MLRRDDIDDIDAWHHAATPNPVGTGLKRVPTAFRGRSGKGDAEQLEELHIRVAPPPRLKTLDRAD